MKLEGNVFVITGGSNGLGRAVARLFVSKGSKVILLDINSIAGQKLEQELSPNALFIQTDVTKENEVQLAIDKGLQKFRKISGCINCAGGGMIERLIETSPNNSNQIKIHSLQTFTKMININLIGTFNVLRLCAKAMINNKLDDDKERGVIINVASIAAFDGQRGQCAYTAAKSAVVGMTLPIARDLGIFGIRIVTICPGIHKTERIEKVKHKRPQGWAERIVQQHTFPKRMGNPDTDFAPLCQHVVENTFLNGESIRLDAGCRKLPY